MMTFDNAAKPILFDRAGLMARLRDHFSLNWEGIHGAAHWARVKQNGLFLAGFNGARADLVELFAFLHDSCRWNDNDDFYHGHRAAEFIEQINGEYFNLTQADLALLQAACIDHSNGYTEADVTIQTCWDADRLDLWRVGIQPMSRYLCTEAAKHIADFHFCEQDFRVVLPDAGTLKLALSATLSYGSPSMPG